LGATLHLVYVTNGESCGSAAQRWPLSVLPGGESEIEVSLAVLQGPIAARIAEYADSVDADLLVMASRTYASWTGFWKKSVTKEVMRLSHRPVCISSRTETDRDFRFRNYRILCVVGLDGKETALVRRAEEIAAKACAGLVLLHVVPEPTEALLYHAADSSCRPLSRERATEDLADLASSLRLPSTTSVMVGDPDKCVALAAREHSVDLVLSARGRAGLQSTYGIDLAGVLRRLHCPLLTIPVDAPATVHAANENRSRVWRPRLRPTVSTVVAALKR
jgi:nucleotide-binding universal stress UspA family protein